MTLLLALLLVIGVFGWALYIECRDHDRLVRWINGEDE